jgi:hypothetical protein
MSPRWVAVKNTAALEFESGAGVRRMSGQLANISRDGALIATEEASRPHGLLWIRMNDPVKTDWIEAVAVRCDQSHQIGLRFCSPCPDDFLLAAMLGIDFGPTILDFGRPLSLDDVVVGV